VREEKVRELVGCLHGHAGETVEVGRVVFSGVLTLVSNVLFSEDVADMSSEGAQELEMLIRGMVEEFTRPNLSDLFPVLSALDLQGCRRRSAQHLRRFSDFFDRIVGRRMKGAAAGERNDDFLDVLLQLHSENQLSLESLNCFLQVRESFSYWTAI
jgi:hypothetical protein